MVIIASAYVIFTATAYLFPQYFYYHPSSAKPDINEARSPGYPVQEVTFQSADETKLYGWLTPPQPGQKMIIFFHGNAYDISFISAKAQPFAERGYGTFLPEYRGFGGLKGDITEKNLAADAAAAIKYLNSLGYKNEDIIVYGISLGSYLATRVVHDLQSNGRFNALILEVPFDSLTKTAKDHVPFYIPDFIIRDKYDSAALIKNIGTRLLIQAGGLDTLIPPAHAQNLFDQAIEPKTFKIYPHADHNNLLSFGNYNDIMAWLENKNNE